MPLHAIYIQVLGTYLAHCIAAICELLGQMVLTFLRVVSSLCCLIECSVSAMELELLQVSVANPTADDLLATVIHCCYRGICFDLGVAKSLCAKLLLLQATVDRILQFQQRILSSAGRMCALHIAFS